MAGCTEGYGGEVFLNTRSIGSRYESAACGYLIDKGYKILERNYKNKLGEIDIIAESADDVLVYCEVKYRSNDVHHLRLWDMPRGEGLEELLLFILQ